MTGQSNGIAARVVAKTEVAERVVELTLESAGGPLPAFSAGAHIDIHLGNDLVRQYSLCGDLHDHDRWRVAVLHEVDGRGGSAIIHDQVRVGDVLTVSAPRNHFPLEPAKEYLFIAGGIGITPFLPMIQEADLAQRGWRLVYGGRSRASMAYLPMLEAFDDRVTVWPMDERGLIDLATLLGTVDEDLAVYSCGPEPLLEAVEAACATWPTGTLRTERFKAVVSDDPAEAFEVEIASTGEVVVIPPESSVLDVLRDRGLDIPWSCSDGTCGTCETRVLAGQPDHRDVVLSPEEQEAGEYMMVCVSRAKCARLTLDV